MDKWRESPFFDQDEDPMATMANLVDIILVFACGLVAALVALSPDLQTHFQVNVSPEANRAAQQGQQISPGRELPQVPEQLGKQMQSGAGYEPVGQVYRDPATGKLILIGE